MDLDWIDGPPPFVGWWQASAAMDAEEWRWWDGTQWSCTALADMEPSEVRENAAVPTLEGGVQWTWYWPENARVARVAPGGTLSFVQVDGNGKQSKPVYVDPRKYGPAGKPPTNAELDAMDEDLAQQAAEDDIDFS